MIRDDLWVVDSLEYYLELITVWNDSYRCVSYLGICVKQTSIEHIPLALSLLSNLLSVTDFLLQALLILQLLLSLLELHLLFLNTFFL